MPERLVSEEKEINLSEEVQLVDEFSHVFFGGKDVDATSNVLDERGPRDDRKLGKDPSPVGQDRHRGVEDPKRLRQTLKQTYHTLCGSRSELYLSNFNKGGWLNARPDGPTLEARRAESGAPPSS